MLRRTALKGLYFHDDPDVLVSLNKGIHDYDSLREAECAVDNGELSELGLEALEEGMIERGEL